MIKLPKECRVNRHLPKNKFYEKLTISSKLKNEFVEKIEKITWLYKISQDTCNINKTNEIIEKQIFVIKKTIFKRKKNITTIKTS